MLDSAELERLSASPLRGSVADLLESVLAKPVGDLMARPRKNLRGELVRLGFELTQAREGEGITEEDLAVCSRCAEILEALHAGSLAIDDIQDGSLFRRGEPSLHSRYGMPIALTAGNWLYFWPTKIIRDLGLPPERELKIYHRYHSTLLQAHIGQALDVGVAIDSLPRDRIAEVCLASLELKSGALAAFSLSLGAIAAGAEDCLISIVEEFGLGFGIALQMFDDLGNLRSTHDPQKRFEDLKLRRPSWIWACVAQSESENLFDTLVKAIAYLPESTRLEDWLLQHSDFLLQCREQAWQRLHEAQRILEQKIGPAERFRSSLAGLRKLGERLATSYG